MLVESPTCNFSENYLVLRDQGLKVLKVNTVSLSQGTKTKPKHLIIGFK